MCGIGQHGYFSRSATLSLQRLNGSSRPHWPAIARAEMSRSTTAIPIALATTIIAAGCGGAQVAPPVSPSPVTAPADATATLQLLSVMPLSGEHVSRDSVISADLVYSVSGFRRGDFFILWQAETLDPTRTTNGTFPHDQLPVLQESMGTVRFSFPIYHVWDEPRVKRPFRIWFSVNRYTGPTNSRVIAQTSTIEYDAQ
jgi:hypothetical protein